MCAVMVLASVAEAENCSIRVTKIDGLLAPDTIGAGDTIVFHLQFANPRDDDVWIMSSGFKLFSRASLNAGAIGSGSAVWTTPSPVNRPFGWEFGSSGGNTGPQVDTNGYFRKRSFLYFNFRCYNCDGSGSDTIGFSGHASTDVNPIGLQAHDTVEGFNVWIVTRREDSGKVICFDSTTLWGGSASWKWIGEFCGPACDPFIFPDWSGPHCFVLAAHPCCVGYTGNIDCSANGIVDITDVTFLIDHLFINHQPLCCSEQANCDGVDGVDIGDLSALIDRLYTSFASLAPCPE